MKTIILAIAAVMFMSTNAFAQGFGQRENRRFSPEEMVQRQTDRLASVLGLNDAQKAELLKLNKEYAGKRRQGMGFGSRGNRNRGERDTVNVNRSSGDHMKEMRAQMAETQEAYKAELKKILTEDQFKKYEEQEKAMQEGMRRGGQGFGRGQGQGFGRGQRQNNGDAPSVEQ